MSAPPICCTQSRIQKYEATTSHTKWGELKPLIMPDKKNPKRNMTQAGDAIANKVGDTLRYISSRK
jgi:hypothetical protein